MAMAGDLHTQLMAGAGADRGVGELAGAGGVRAGVGADPGVGEQPVGVGVVRAGAGAARVGAVSAGGLAAGAAQVGEVVASVAASELVSAAKTNSIGGQKKFRPPFSSLVNSIG